MIREPCRKVDKILKRYRRQKHEVLNVEGPVVFSSIGKALDVTGANSLAVTSPAGWWRVENRDGENKSGK